MYEVTSFWELNVSNRINFLSYSHITCFGMRYENNYRKIITEEIVTNIKLNNHDEGGPFL